MEHKCPLCGADLPEEASFCPHCARTVSPRKTAKVPVPMLKRVLLGLLALVIVSAVAVGLWLNLKPSTYDEYGQVTYTAEDGTVYQVLLASGADRFTPPARADHPLRGGRPVPDALPAVHQQQRLRRGRQSGLSGVGEVGLR